MNIQAVDLLSIAARVDEFHVPLSDCDLQVCNDILLMNRKFTCDDATDAMIVAGYSNCLEDRVPHAETLVRKKLSNLVVLSGGVDIPNTMLTESKAMFAALVECGISKEHLLLENQSKTTIENATFSINAIYEKVEKREISVLAVTSNFHIRRLILALEMACMKLVDRKFHIIPMPSNSSYCEKRTWQNSILGRAIVARELRIIEKHTASGRLRTFDIYDDR